MFAKKERKKNKRLVGCFLLTLLHLIHDIDGASIERKQQGEIKFLEEETSFSKCGHRLYKDSWVANIEGASSSSPSSSSGCLAILIDEGAGVLVASQSGCGDGNLNQEQQPLFAKFAIAAKEIRLPVKWIKTVAENEILIFRLEEPLAKIKEGENDETAIQPVCLASSQEQTKVQLLSELQCKVEEEEEEEEESPSSFFKCPAKVANEAGCGQPLVSVSESRSFLLGFRKCDLGEGDENGDDEEGEASFINVPSLHTLLEWSQDDEESQSNGEQNKDDVSLTQEEEEEKMKKEDIIGVEGCPLIGLCNELYSCYCPPSTTPSNEVCRRETVLLNEALCPVYSFCPSSSEDDLPLLNDDDAFLPFLGASELLVDLMKSERPADVCGARIIGSRIVSSGALPAPAASEKLSEKEEEENDFQFPSSAEDGEAEEEDEGPTPSSTSGTVSSSADAPFTPSPPSISFEVDGDDVGSGLEEKAPSISPPSSSSSLTPQTTSNPQNVTAERDSLEKEEDSQEGEEEEEGLPPCNDGDSFPCRIPHGVCEKMKEGEQDDADDDREKRCRCQAGFHWRKEEGQCVLELPSDADDGTSSQSNEGDDGDEAVAGEDVVRRAKPEEEEAEEESCASHANRDVPCVFPFRFEGELHYDCIKFTSGDNKYGITKKSFCPISVDETTRENVGAWVQCGQGCRLMTYHTHKGLVHDVTTTVKEHAGNAINFSLGHSRGQRELLGIRISQDVGGRARRGPREEPGKDSSAVPFHFRPRVKLIGNMHGNEPVGRELLIHFSKFLLESAAGLRDGERGAERAKRIVATTDLWILPTMNPDGFSRGEEGQCSGGSFSAGRLNNGRKDLNRDFPTWWDWQELQKNSSYDLYAGRQKETKLLMDWILNGHFTLSANFHDGAVLVNYPYDNYHDNKQQFGVFKTPDHDEFYSMSTAYSLNHRTMNDTLKACRHWGTFEEGVTNGADWYPVKGGMQDFNYVFANTMEVTVEVSCCKYAPRWRLLWEWENNRDSLLSYVEQAQKGIKGQVLNAKDEPVVGAKVQVRKTGEAEWRRTFVTTDKNGVYWRILVPGEYEIQAVVEDAQGADGGERRVLARSEVVRASVMDALRPTVVALRVRGVRKMVRRPAGPAIRKDEEEEVIFGA